MLIENFGITPTAVFYTRRSVSPLFTRPRQRLRRLTGSTL